MAGCAFFAAREIGFDAEMQLLGAADEPEPAAFRHFGRLGELLQTENAAVERAAFGFRGGGDGELHVVEPEVGPHGTHFSRR